jgi:hypothetical protein
MLNYNYGFWNWDKKPRANSVAIPITSQDQIRSQLRNPKEKKPDAYKSINSSQIQIITGKNPDEK